MHQLRTILIAEFQGLGQAIDMPIPLPRTALAWQTCGLVQDDDMLILPDHRILDHLGISR